MNKNETYKQEITVKTEHRSSNRQESILFFLTKENQFLSKEITKPETKCSLPLTILINKKTEHQRLKKYSTSTSYLQIFSFRALAMGFTKTLKGYLCSCGIASYQKNVHDQPVVDWWW